MKHLKEMSYKPLMFTVMAALVSATQTFLDVGPVYSEDFGDRQVEQLLDDRPEMRTLIEKNKFIFDWLSDRFNGGSIDLRAYWNAAEPISGFPSECALPHLQYPAHVRVTSRTQLSAEDKCVVLMFEFMNLENDIAFKKLFTAALDHAISAEKFADRAVMLEFEAAKRLQAVIMETRFRSALGSCEFYKRYATMPKDANLTVIKNWPMLNSSFDYWLAEYDRMIRTTNPRSK